MKNLIILLILSCFSVCTLAQEHLSFKGIPITGSMASFCQKLKSKGFTQIERTKNFRTFTGDFTGSKVTVVVAATDNNQSVHSVGVVFDPSVEWNELLKTYEYYKNLYTRKYGSPTVTNENNPATSDSNIAKMGEVYQGTVTYVSAWAVPGGEIDLSIEKSAGFYEGMVVIKYIDAQNVETKIQKQLEEI